MARARPRHRPLTVILLLSASLNLGCGGPASVPVEAGVKADALPEMIRGLKGRDPSLRVRSAVAIGRIGPDAKEAVPSLAAALKDRDPSVKAAAAYSLGQIGPDAGSALGDLKPLAQKAGPLRDVAAEAIQKIER